MALARAKLIAWFAGLAAAAAVGSSLWYAHSRGWLKPAEDLVCMNGRK